MHSLVGYDSDDDLDETPPPRKSAWQLGAQVDFQSQTRLRSVQPSQADVNYEEVQMDLSEDSNDSAGGSQSKEAARNTKPDEYRSRGNELNNDDRRDHFKEDKEKNSRDDYYKEDRFRSDNRFRDDKGKKDDNRIKDDRDRNREDRYRDKERYRDDGDRSREERDRYRDDKEKYREDKGDRDRGRDYRDKYRGRRSSSRERRSRSPRRSDYRRRSRSRSGSRDRGGGKSGYLRRYDRGSARMGRIEKLGIDIKGNNGGPSEQESSENKDRFYMPGITGRFTEQIQRRKMLWQKKEPEKREIAHTVSNTVPSTTTGPKTGKLWEATTFAQDQDGKVANKFKRLMGIRDNSTEGIKPTSEVIKKQEEMFSSMEAQYEVARTATHTMRGVGLGFGSFQR